MTPTAPSGDSGDETMRIALTLALQCLIVYAPVAMLRGMGYDFTDRAKTYGLGWQLLFLAVLIVPPSLALWSAHLRSRRPAGRWSRWRYVFDLFGMLVLLGFSALLVVVSGIR